MGETDDHPGIRAHVKADYLPLSMPPAEKLETVPPRGITNTRPRGFYDAHMLRRLRRDDSREEIPARR